MSIHLIILILHVLGAGVVIGVVLLALASIIKPPLTREAIERMHFVSRFGMIASVWQFLTGIVLSWQDWDEFRSSKLFWTKITLYLIEGAVASLLIEKQAKTAAVQLQNGQPVTGAKIRAGAWIQFLAIIAIAVIGVILVSGSEE